MTKTCPKCESVKPLDEFYRARSKPSGRASWCKKCVAARQKAYRQKHRDLIAARQKEYVATNREAHAERTKAWYEANRDAVLQKRRVKRDENRRRHLQDGVPTDGSKRCSDCKETKPVTEFYLWLSASDGRQQRCKPCDGSSDYVSRSTREAIYERDSWSCQICGGEVDLDNQTPEGWPGPESASLDHIMPRSLGGSDDPTNLRTAHRSCNTKRGASVLEHA